MSPAAAMNQHGQMQPAHRAPEIFIDPSDEKGREVERLRKELRKVEEKTEFFKKQVMTLQQQVHSMGGIPGGDPNSMGAPPGGSAGAGGSPAELHHSRQELQQEQARTQQFRAELGNMGSPAARASPSDHGALEARVRELEQQLAATQSGAGHLTGITTTIATPTRSVGRPMSGMDEHSPMGGPMASMQRHDPFATPGGSKRVIIVGCNYPGQTGTLRAGVADAQQWARFFTKKCAVPEKDIQLLTDDGDYRESTIATKENIMRALHWLTARSATGDQIFFVFCGHGVQVLAEEFAGHRLCENALAPTDVAADGAHPRVVSDSEVHKALQMVPSGAQATLIYDSCHAGSPLDRQGLNYLTDHVKRGNVDYEKLKGHPVLPRFLEFTHWKVRPNPPEAVRESRLQCQAVMWAACTNEQFCVELPIEERARGVFTYIFICALLKQSVSASSDALLLEMRTLTESLQGRWRLQQDVRMVMDSTTCGTQKFLR